jgi:pyruvate dehydrogenase E2 component (dihydrolipoamide acetyltransferase)
MSTFRLPDLGEGLSDAEIVAWHVSPGDHVVADQPLVSVETAKAVVEIPSPEAGRIAAVYGKPGDVVNIGAKLVDYEDRPGEPSETVVGELPHDGQDRAAPAARTVASGEGIKAAPAVRRLARELGVDLKGIAASGPGGSLTADDVRAAAKPLQQAPGEPLRGPRRAMAQAMTKAGAEAVAATVTDEANIESWPQGADPMLRLVAAMVAAASAEPALNAWFDGASMRRLMHDHVDLGIAMDTAEGLFVPVLKGAEALSDKARGDRLEALKAAVRERSIAPHDLSGATITLSNFGTIGGRHGALVVMPPQVAILGAGRIAPSVLVVDGRPRVCRTLPLSLTFDHRAVTGGEAARFLAAVIGSLEQEC